MGRHAAKRLRARTWLTVEALEARVTPVLAKSPLEMAFLGRYDTGFGDTGSEIVAHDPTSQRLFVVHGIDDPADAPASSIEIVSIANPASPVKVGAIDIAPFGRTANSAAFKNGILAIAVEATLKTDVGRVVFFNANGTFLGQVTAGALPDMLTFTPDGLKVLVANEGEPNSYNQMDSVDPVGSVTIVNLAGGPGAATVQTVSFAAFIGQENLLRAQGIRIYGPNANAAQDFEPEYITTDGTTAWVTLQENNAMAIVDVATATVTQIVPLGFKNHSIGGPFTESYTFQNMPVLGNVNGEEIQFGGFSGLQFEGYDAAGNLKFITHTDRGPNGEPVGINRPFLIPTFNLEIVRFTLNRVTGELTITQRLQLKKPNGSPLTGLPNINISGNANQAYNDEVPTDFNFVPLGTLDPLGADLEGIAVDADGSFWMCDEYRPAIYHFDSSGLLIDRFIPIGTHAAAGVAYTPGTFGTFGKELLPAVLGQRRQNRGFEAIALQGGKIYAMVQSPLRNPVSSSNTALNARQTVRLVEFDPNTLATRQFLYRMDNASGLGTTRGDKIGDMAALIGGGFLVVERDDDVTPTDPIHLIEKKVYRFDLTGATPITAANDILYSGKTLDEMTLAELQTALIVPLAKTLHTDLATAGYNKVSKVEGLTIIDAGTIAVINDNDFLVGPLNEPIVLGLIRTNALDASDRDVPGASNNGIINIQNWPVFGMYQPDAIASFSVNGQTYLITANEGDARDWPGFAEEVRVGALDLDNTLFPNETFLKNNDNLGRLTVTSTLGNDGGDGDFERLYALGARSFSIWTASGQLLFDSGADLEVITAAQLPALFNSDGAAGSFDTRSDNKGPEPESVTIGVIGGRTYAFIGLERIGGVMVYDVTNPAAAKFVQYINTSPTDTAPEGLIYIKAEDSPNGRPLVVNANEVSGTVSLFQIFSPDLVFDGIPGAAANNMVLRRNGADIELIDAVNGRILRRQALDMTRSFTINGANGEAETLTVDHLFGGSFALAGGVFFNGGTGAGDELRVLSNGNGDSVVVTGSQAVVNGTFNAGWSGIEGLTFDLGEGPNQFTVTGQVLQQGIVDLVSGGDDDVYTLGTIGTYVRISDTGGSDTVDFTPAVAGPGFKSPAAASGWIGANGTAPLTTGVFVHFGINAGQAQNIDSLGNKLALLATIEQIIGSPFNDVLIGNSLANDIFGRGGHDALFGGAGDDYLDGGSGNDAVLGEHGRDLLLGLAGRDLILGGRGRDLAIGGTGLDIIQGNWDGDIIIGSSTVHDGDRDALEAILAVWTGNLSFNQRVQILQAGLLAPINLIDDGTVDLLFGRVGLDWVVQ